MGHTSSRANSDGARRPAATPATSIPERPMVRIAVPAGWHRGGWIILAATPVCLILNVLVDADPVRSITGLALLTLLPGMALSYLFAPRGELDPVTRACVAVGFSMLAYCAVFMLLSHLVDRLTLRMVLSLPVISLALIAFFKESEPKPRTTCRGWWITLLLVMMMAGAAALRFVQLGYSEFLGDEAGNCLVNSLRVVSGDNAVLLHPQLTPFTRPPAQVLIPAMTYFLTDTLDETVIRYPFALAGLASVWMAYRLGRELFGSPTTGLVAGYLAALNGFMIAFSRGVQYQSVTALALLTATFFLWRTVRSECAPDARRNLLAGTAMFGLAMLAHFEAVLFVPVILLAALRSPGLRPKATSWLPAIGLLFAVLAPFYLPFCLDTSLLTQLWNENPASPFLPGEATALHFHLESLWRYGSLYTSIPYLVALALLSALAFLRRPSLPEVLMVLWFLPFFLFYAVASDTPTDHLNTFLFPLLPLAGRGVQLTWQATRRGSGRRRALGLTTAVFLGAAAVMTVSHVCRAFVDNDPEYLSTMSRREFPKLHAFGFPHHRGWKTVGYLFRTGRLSGTYQSNEDPKITTFYLRQSPQPSRAADYILQAAAPRTRRVGRHIGSEYSLIGRVLFRGKTTIDIYGRTPAGSVTEFTAEEFDHLYAELDRVRSGTVDSPLELITPDWRRSARPQS
jgi:hypothetical protein